MPNESSTSPASRRPLGTIVRWTIVLAAVGIALGVCFMFGRVPAYVDSGAKPTNIGFYSFWIPLLGILGALTGLVIGAIAALVSAIRRGRGRHS